MVGCFERKKEQAKGGSMVKKEQAKDRLGEKRSKLEEECGFAFIELN